MGFELKSFVKTPQTWLICKKCNKVLENCIKIKDKRICEKCYENQNEKFEFDLEMNSLIDNLQVFCKNKRLKCNWVGKNAEQKLHSKTCPFRLVNCRHCKKIQSFHSLEKHESNCIQCQTCESTQNEMKQNQKEMEKLKLENSNLKLYNSPSTLQKVKTFNIYPQEFEKLKLENFNLKVQQEKIIKDEKNILFENLNLKEENSKLKFELSKNFDQIYNLT
jgi:hypothetical protein